MSTAAQQERTRTYAWGDPAAVVEAFVARATGLELLHGIGAGTLPEPPALRTLGIVPVSAVPGRVVFSLEPQEFHLNPMGIVHGGVLVALLDTAMGCAVHSHLGAGQAYVTLELSAQFLRAVSPTTGTVVCTGTAQTSDGRTMQAEARVEDGQRRLLATATSTCLLQSL